MEVGGVSKLIISKRKSKRQTEREREGQTYTHTEREGHKLVISLSGRQGLLGVYLLHTPHTHTVHGVLVILYHLGDKETMQMEENKENICD